MREFRRGHGGGRLPKNYSSTSNINLLTEFKTKAFSFTLQLHSNNKHTIHNDAEGHLCISGPGSPCFYRPKNVLSSQTNLTPHISRHNNGKDTFISTFLQLDRLVCAYGISRTINDRPLQARSAHDLFSTTIRPAT